MRYAIATLLVLFLLVVGIVVIAGRDDSPSKPTTQTVKVSNLASSRNTVVSWTRQGEITAEENYHEVRIAVSSSQRIIEIIAGYNNKSIERKVFPNTPAAFESFLFALDRANFGSSADVLQPDVRGMCPLGNRYIYTINENGSEKLHTWSDSCSPRDGTFGGNTTNTGRLFQKQIPEYSKLLKGISF